MKLDVNIDFDIDFSGRKHSVNSNLLIDDCFVKLKNQKIIAKNVVYDNASFLAKEIKIKRGETVFFNLNGKFIFGDFIGAFIQENNLTVKELTIVSLSGGVDNFEMMEALIEKGWVGQINLILSEYFLRTETSKHTKTIELLKNLVVKFGDKFNVSYTNIHSKVVLIKTSHNGENGYITMQGSANLRSSQSLEQMSIHENKELYNFNYNYFKSLI
jgi:hypothetical protein